MECLLLLLRLGPTRGHRILQGRLQSSHFVHCHSQLRPDFLLGGGHFFLHPALVRRNPLSQLRNEDFCSLQVTMRTGHFCLGFLHPGVEAVVQALQGAVHLGSGEFWFIDGILQAAHQVLGLGCSISRRILHMGFGLWFSALFLHGRGVICFSGGHEDHVGPRFGGICGWWKLVSRMYIRGVSRSWSHLQLRGQGSGCTNIRSLKDTPDFGQPAPPERGRCLSLGVLEHWIPLLGGFSMQADLGGCWGWGWSFWGGLLYFRVFQIAGLFTGC